jgi:hypothetical protein
MLPKVIVLGIAAALSLSVRSLGLLFRRNRRHSVIRHLPGLRHGVTVKGVALSGAAVKRAQLLAEVGLRKLWGRSKLAFLGLMWMGLRICLHALRLKLKRYVTGEAAA